MPKKKFRVGVAAKTIDGREIKPEWLTSIAETYDPDVYGARVNLEHFRSVYPDSAFGMYGDVLSVEAKTETLAGEDRVCLYAEIEANDDLLELNKKGQKVYTSMEIDFNYPNDGQYYLSGLAITDSPASMGTQRLSFSAAEKTKHIFTAYAECDLFADDEDTSPESFDQNTDNKPKLLSRVKAIFSKQSAEQKGVNADVEQAIEAIANEVAEFSKQIPADNSEQVTQLTQQLDEAKHKLDQVTNDFNDLKKELDDVELFSKRPAASGGDTTDDEGY